MSTKGLGKEVFKIAWPLIISELGDSIYSLTDTYFVSKVGTNALAAVGLGSYLSWLFYVVVAVFAMGVMVYVAQAYGAKEFFKARTGLGESLIFSMVVASGVTLAVLPYINALMNLLGGNNPPVVNLGTQYFAVRILGLPFISAVMVMDSGVRAAGATKYSMIANISSVGLNAVLDPLLIFGLLGLPALGVAGAALATVIAIIYMIPLEIIFLHKLSLDPALSMWLEPIKRIVRLGGPAALERFVFAVGNNLYIAFIARCGSVALAAHQVGVRIESFIYMPGFAFSMAGAVLVGQRLGIEDVEGGKKYAYEAIRMSLILMSSLGVFIALAGPYIASPFSSGPQVTKLAALYLLLAGLSEPGLSLAQASAGAIRGGGNTTTPMLVNVTGLFLLRVLPSAILTGIFGVLGAWLAMFMDVWVRGLVMFTIFHRRFSRLARKIT